MGFDSPISYLYEMSRHTGSSSSIFQPSPSTGKQGSIVAAPPLTPLTLSSLSFAKVKPYIGIRAMASGSSPLPTVDSPTKVSIEEVKPLSIVFHCCSVVVAVIPASLLAVSLVCSKSCLAFPWPISKRHKLLVLCCVGKA